MPEFLVPHYGEWQEERGGMMWRHPLSDTFIEIVDENDDGKNYELWVGDNKEGNSETIAHFRKFENALRAAKIFMVKNPNGWV